ncbi:hypothetical protein A0J48_024275 [Sphaerospermopsis aphanizomenoides BCCUSP55]|uniref:hypothetical protein n=1 Tax=Sphaerospermopsis aphanizomenoides TaxID=459663 RepID=UPI001904E505|nr:hypothetical protein [Sphaerospermopsis aphanizomenoides]MBK1990600.1 hypothetical protein [Sphaerospermopsis aphanizomenoides BCCUSP55]
MLQGNIPLYTEYLKTDLEIISQNLETAIRQLAHKSELNKNRAKYLYNIDIDNQPHPENP